MFTGKQLPPHSHSTVPEPLIGVVVESFSYVFQTSGRGAKSISREQMRAFKKLWAEYANPKGNLEQQHFGAFFYVSVRIIVYKNLLKFSTAFEWGI
jgi:hypothetical protein